MFVVTNSLIIDLGSKLSLLKSIIVSLGFTLTEIDLMFVNSLLFKSLSRLFLNNELSLIETSVYCFVDSSNGKFGSLFT